MVRTRADQEREAQGAEAESHFKDKAGRWALSAPACGGSRRSSGRGGRPPPPGGTAACCTRPCALRRPAYSGPESVQKCAQELHTLGRIERRRTKNSSKWTCARDRLQSISTRDDTYSSCTVLVRLLNGTGSRPEHRHWYSTTARATAHAFPVTPSCRFLTPLGWRPPAAVPSLGGTKQGPHSFERAGT